MSKFVELNLYISEGVSVWCHQFVWKQPSEFHPVHSSNYILQLVKIFVSHLHTYAWCFHRSLL